jgi:hypothetical protein
MKALAVLAAVATASAGPAAFAVCGDFGGFPVFQCADRAYFGPPPAGSGAVTSAFWQLGYGNATLATGTGSDGTGTAGPAIFNGNDNGNWAVDLVDARAIIGDTRVPVGSVCLRSNNFGNAGIDGCCDNNRESTNPGGDKDGGLNFEFNVYYASNGYPGVPSRDWILDYGVGVLLEEASGHHFAVAAVGSSPRTGPNDQRVGDYNFKNVTSGDANPITGSPNIIPWQRIPGDRDPSDASTNFVTGASFVPGDPANPNQKMVSLSWKKATVHSDASVNPTTNSSMLSPGVGVNDQGPLVRYVVETQPIVNAADPIGSLNPNGWTAVDTVIDNGSPSYTGSVTVSPDTCIRLHTFFGKNPSSTGPAATRPNCKLGKCGDLGYDVAGAPACVGGPLASESPILSASRGKGGIVEVRINMPHELTVTSYQVYAVTKRGSIQIGEISATKTGSGEAASYTFKVEATKIKGARFIEVVAVPTGVKQRIAIK